MSLTQKAKITAPQLFFICPLPPSVPSPPQRWLEVAFMKSFFIVLLTKGRARPCTVTTSDAMFTTRIILFVYTLRNVLYHYDRRVCVCCTPPYNKCIIMRSDDGLLRGRENASSYKNCLMIMGRCLRA